MIQLRGGRNLLWWSSVSLFSAW